MRLIRLANAIVKTRPKPQYVVFPELAIPRAWARTIAHHFLKERISLIVGVEYKHLEVGKNAYVINESRLYLTDNRLGYPSHCVLTQRKGLPAHHERDELRARFGISLAPIEPATRIKRVYRHFGFCFGVLVCSELTDIAYREQFRGNVDNLFVLSWNQDLESFASLVEASALDVHAFITLVNNREFGDSRVRAPSKKPWRRDVVRVKGGMDDYFVVAEIDVGALREFQSHTESPPEPFKPVPEGFSIAKHRYRVPGA